MKRQLVLNRVVLLLGVFSVVARADWTVDFSRRTQSATKPTAENLQEPAEPDESQGRKSFLGRIFSWGSDSSEAVQEIVILQTETGFVPQRVPVRQGLTYKMSVVNVNEKERNVSFVLDAFSEHHATYYGKIKSFMIHPQQDGIFSFQSPETAFQGQLVVLPSEMPKSPTEELKKMDGRRVKVEEIPSEPQGEPLSMDRAPSASAVAPASQIRGPAAEE